MPAKSTGSTKKNALKDPKGGLTQAGRDHFKETEGANLKPGVTGPADTPEKMKRKGSFLRRHFANPDPGPLKDEKGKPTRRALSAHAWGEPVPATTADVKKLAAKGKELLEQYHETKEGEGNKGKKKPAAKKAAPKAPKKKLAAKSKSDAGTYTKPELREKIKTQVKAGDKGGRPGQWSARKAQLVASEYEKEGGGYKPGSRTTGQKHLESWTNEKWQTADGKKAIQGKTTSRYLPKKAWDKLTPTEKKATDAKKKNISKTGKQNVPNTAAARKARQETAQ